MTNRDEPTLTIDPGSGVWVDEQRVFDGVYHARTAWGLLPVGHVDHPVVEDLERLHLSVADFQATAASIKHSLAMPPTPAESDADLVADVLFQGAVISYCRSFDPTTANSLDQRDVYGDAARLLTLHDLIWNLRSKHYGHDVNGFRDAGVGVCISPDGNQFKVTNQIYKMTPPPELLRDFLKLIEFAIAHCKGLTGALEEIVYKHLDETWVGRSLRHCLCWN